MLRRFRLSTDLRISARLIPEVFQYPENDSWSIQTDEKKQITDKLNNSARAWWLLSLLQLLSPTLRDAVRGYIWEEKNQPVGLVYFQRKGLTDAWYIALIGVLPSYRRQGIGRKLTQTALDFIRQREGKSAFLKVVACNTPACALYESLGFRHFASEIRFEHAGKVSLPACPIPSGYTESPLPLSDWKTRYEFAQQITPDAVQKYTPCRKSVFRRPWPAHVAEAIIRKAEGVREEASIIESSGRVFAIADHSVRLKPGGVNYISLQVDPAHLELAPYMVHRSIRTVLELSPGRRIEIPTPTWQEGLVQTLTAVGCVPRWEHLNMGIQLE
ncbi:MAG: GNAT family N-acetyltransferase [Anaerolineaceae bacterium]|nr:GNAT family N-acetyltransferase [Anaerolineaceae bacterium]